MVSLRAPREVAEQFNKLLLDPPVRETELKQLIRMLERHASSRRGGIVEVEVPSVSIDIGELYRVLGDLEFGGDLVVSLAKNAVTKVEKDGTLYLLLVRFGEYEHIKGTNIVARIASVESYSVDNLRGLRKEGLVVTYEPIYNAVKDMLIEDFKNGDIHLRNLHFIHDWVPVGFLGFEEVTREVYRMLREGRVYGRVEVVDDLGRRVTYHLIIPPETGGVLYVVEAGGKLYVTEVGGLSDVKPRRVEDFERAEKRSMEVSEYRDALETMEKEILESDIAALLPTEIQILLLERMVVRAILSS